MHVEDTKPLPAERRKPPGLRWRVPEDLPYFRGHFPGRPILPGVATLHDFVLPGVTAQLPDLGPLRHIRRLKFHRPIRPGDEIEMTLERDNCNPIVHFRIVRGGERCASGTLIFAPSTNVAIPE